MTERGANWARVCFKLGRSEPSVHAGSVFIPAGLVAETYLWVTVYCDDRGMWQHYGTSWDKFEVVPITCLACLGAMPVGWCAKPLEKP